MNVRFIRILRARCQRYFLLSYVIIIERHFIRILRERLRSFMIIPRSLKYEMFQTKFVDEIKTHVLSLLVFFYETRVFCEVMWKYMVKPDRP
jgi:hypothetical protein